MCVFGGFVVYVCVCCVCLLMSMCVVLTKISTKQQISLDFDHPRSPLVGQTEHRELTQSQSRTAASMSLATRRLARTRIEKHMVRSNATTTITYEALQFDREPNVMCVKKSVILFSTISIDFIIHCKHVIIKYCRQLCGSKILLPSDNTKLI